ncbi:hypothetical protein [Aureliella helgolandensis]|uniref:hypothetical protein n=1 Tax=Aureliella helgolandensis TaxID=2527968 RepID=UPI0011A7B5D3|nr:hypothetical protein [Aureliella helgolandensis]
MLELFRRAMRLKEMLLGPVLDDRLILNVIRFDHDVADEPRIEREDRWPIHFAAQRPSTVPR